MLGAKAIGRWRFVHKWSSIACAAFLLITCLTGLPLIFEEELEAWSMPQVDHSSTPHVGEKLTPETAVHVAEAAHPGQAAQFVYWPDEEAIGVGLAIPGTDGSLHRVRVDAWSRAVTEEVDPAETVLEPILELHRSLFLGTIGECILAAVGLAFALALISGVLVYRPFMRRLDFGTIRRSTRRTAWLDRHNLFGIATLAWAVVVALTGFMNALEGPLFAAWQAQRTPVLMAKFADRPPPIHRASIDAVLATARSALPGYEATSVNLPNTDFSTPRHYLIWFHGSSILTRRIFTPVMLDGETGELASIEYLPWYLRAVEVSRPLHFGDYGGLPLKILWALFDVITMIVIASGLYLWLRSRRASMDDLL